MHLLTLVTYAGYYLLVVFLCLCFACGLWTLAELVEEHTHAVAKVLKYAIRGQLGLHLALLVWDRAPLVPLLLGLAAHASYIPLLRYFPWIPLSSLEALLAAGMALANAAAWSVHLWHSDLHAQECLAVFVALPLAVPFVLVLSLAANESVLPGVPGSAPPKGHKAHRSAMLTLFGTFQRQKDALLPRAGAWLGTDKAHGV